MHLISEEKLEGFKRLGDYMCQKHNVSKLSFEIGQPHPEAKLYLRYYLKQRTFAIELIDGMSIAQRTAEMVLPSALGVMLSMYQSMNKIK